MNFNQKRKKGILKGGIPHIGALFLKTGSYLGIYRDGGGNMIKTGEI